MEESETFLNYFRRWGVILLIGFIIGGLAGYGLFSRSAEPMRFQAEANVAIPIAGTFVFAVVSSESADPKDAVLDVLAIVDQLSNRTEHDVDISEIVIKREYRFPRWKAIALGNVVGLILVIGFAHVWDDAWGYQRG